MPGPPLARTRGPASRRCRRKQHIPLGALGTLRRSAAASPTCARGRRATTSTSPSARATCRPRRCRWRSPTRRSPTAAASPRPHLGLEVEDASGRPSSASSRRPARHVEIDPTGATRCSTACTRRPARRAAPRPTSGRAGTRPPSRSTARPAPPRPGQDDQSWYVCFVHPRAEAPDRHRRHRRAGRLRRRGGRPGRAPDRSSQWFGQSAKLVAGNSTDADERDPDPRRAGTARRAAAAPPPRRCLPFDPVLLLAVARACARARW